MMNTYQCKSDIISVNEKEKLLSAARTYKYVNYNTDKGTETGLEFISTLNERNKNSIPIDTIKQFINRVNPQCNFFIAAFIKFASKARYLSPVIPATLLCGEIRRLADQGI